LTNMGRTHKMRLLIATGNRGKFEEICALLEGLEVLLVPLDRNLAMSMPPESGDAFQENARIKAEAAARLSRSVALADDSGLEVDALGGQPGVLSARFGGPGNTDADRCRLLLDKLAGIPLDRRAARFRCVVAVAEPSGRVQFAEGVCEGRITEAPRGAQGFGYDPVFEVPTLGRTLAEVGPEIKNRLSHRAQAVVKARAILETLLAGSDGWAE
jgi:XTP/dITP diphosphohydrolase